MKLLEKAWKCGLTLVSLVHAGQIVKQQDAVLGATEQFCIAYKKKNIKHLNEL